MIRNQPLLWVLSIGFEMMEVSSFIWDIHLLWFPFSVQVDCLLLCPWTCYHLCMLKLAIFFHCGLNFMFAFFSLHFATCYQISMSAGGTVWFLTFWSAIGLVRFLLHFLLVGRVFFNRIKCTKTLELLCCCSKTPLRFFFFPCQLWYGNR